MDLDDDVELESFPWQDDKDTGFDVVPFDPEQDMAPEGGEFDCDGREDDDG